jgi:hypothetical protein
MVIRPYQADLGSLTRLSRHAYNHYPEPGPAVTILWPETYHEGQEEGLRNGRRGKTAR